MTASPRLFDRLIAAWHERAIVLKAMSFAAVGVVNSAVDFGVFSFAYYYLELPIVAANVMAWLVAVSGSYVMNSLTTFARESGRELRAKAYFTFMLSQVAGLARQHHHRLRRVLFHAGAGSARCSRSAQAFWSTSRCRTSSCFASARSENRGSAIVQLTKHGHVGMRHHPGGRTAQSDPLPVAHKLWSQVDVVLAVGTRLHLQQMAWGLDADLKVIRIDIDAEEIARFAQPAVGIVGDSAQALGALFDAIRGKNPARRSPPGELGRARAAFDTEVSELQPNSTISRRSAPHCPRTASWSTR